MGQGSPVGAERLRSRVSQRRDEHRIVSKEAPKSLSDWPHGSEAKSKTGIGSRTFQGAFRLTPAIIPDFTLPDVLTSWRPSRPDVQRRDLTPRLHHVCR